MTTKFKNAKRYATAAVAVADKAGTAWTVWVTANAVIVWSVQMFFSTPAMTAANDNEAKPFVAAGSALMQPYPLAAVAAEPPAQRFGLATQPLPQTSNDPAQAVWRYLCSRDAALGAAADAPCGTSAALSMPTLAQADSREEPTRRTDPFAWSERLNAANDNHHIVEE